MRPDPLRCLDHAIALHRFAMERSRGRPVELFHRLSLHSSAAREGLEAGEEEGVAVRVRDERGRAVGFAATTGGEKDAVAWAVERACRLLASRAWTDEGESWARREGKLLADLDSGEVDPPESLDRWLTMATAELGSPGDGRVDAALTVECVVNDSGVRAVRVRRRVAARLAWPGAGPDSPGAWRTFLAADVAGLSLGLAAERGLPGSGRAGRYGAEPVPLLLLPEPASVLIRSLVQALHLEHRSIGLRVGPAWKIAEDPLAPDSPFGATFDDVGFDTRAIELADGRAVRAILKGPGLFRRPSFRDPPSRLALNLRVKAEPEAAPERFAVVSGLRIHPTDRGWLLELTIHPPARSGDVPVGAKRFARIEPEQLVLMVGAVVGRPRPTAQGVFTPGLILERLQPAPP